MADQMAESEPVITELEMGMSSGLSTLRSVRATVVQASTIFYDTPATLGITQFFYWVQFVFEIWAVGIVIKG